MKSLKEINKFYWVFAGLLLLLAILVIFSARTIFSAMTVSNQIDEEVLDRSRPHLNASLLDEALGKASGQKVPQLDLRQ